jgi:hypothetical protein
MRVDVGENRRGIHVDQYVGGGHEGECRHDHFIVRAHVERKQRRMQGRGSVGCGHGVRRIAEGLQLLLQAVDIRAARNPGRAQRIHGPALLLTPIAGLGPGDVLSHQNFSPSW